MRRRKLVVVAALAVFLPVAAGFGYMTGEQAATVSPGADATFSWYVFGDPPFHAANMSTPAGWTASVSPGTVTADSPHRYQATSDGYQRIYRMRLTVHIPSAATPGTYTVTPTLTAAAEPSSGVRVRHVQPIPFTVTVSGTPVEQDGEPVEHGQETVSRENMSHDGAGSTSPPSPTGRAAEKEESTSPEDDGVLRWLAAFLLFQAVWIAALLYVRR